MFEIPTKTTIDHHISYAQKRKDNWKWAKDSYELLYRAHTVPQKELARLKLKFNLANGMMPDLNIKDLSMFGIKVPPHVQKKKFQLIPHQPCMDKIYEFMMGQRQRQRFEPVAIDIGIFSHSEKSRLHQLYINNELTKSIYEPYRQMVTQEYARMYNIDNPANFSHEDQQDMKAEIDKKTHELTPDKIDEFFDKEYVSPLSIESMQLLEYEIKTKNLNRHFIENFRNLYIGNGEVSFLYESHGNPRIDRCKLSGFTCYGSDDIDCIEDMELASYRILRTPMDIIARYGGDISLADIKEIETSSNLYENIYDRKSRSPLTSREEMDMIGFYDGNQAQVFPDGINLRTPEGQEKMMAFQSMFRRSNSGLAPLIEDSHICFRTPVVMKQVKRIVNDREEYSWRDADYELNPDYGDILHTEVRSTEVIGVRRVGTIGKGVYVKAGPEKFQWADIDDPRKKKLPYWGGFLGKLMGEAEPRGYFDKGIGKQISINIEAARLEEEKGFNMGKLFMMLLSLKPADMSEEMFVDTMRGSRIIPIDDKLLTGPLQSLIAGGHALKSIDMSNDPNIVAVMNHLAVMYNDLATTMGLDDSVSGGASPYASTETNRQNMVNGSNKTLNLYTIHNEHIKNTLQGYMEFCRYVYRKNPRVLEWMADDKSMAQLKLSDEFLNYGKAGIYFSNDPDDLKQLDLFKEDARFAIQNQAYIMLPYLARVRFAKTQAEVLNAVEALQKISSEQQQQAQQAAQQQQQQMIQAEAQKLAQQQQHEKEMQDADDQTKYGLAAINATQFLQAQDVNKDGISDVNEREAQQREFERKENEKDRQLQLIIESKRAALMKKQAAQRTKSKK
jgi:hypothetical protein